MKRRRRRATRFSTAPRVQMRDAKRVSAAQVKRLFREAGWTEDIVRYSPKQVQKLLCCSHLVRTAWDDKKLVGFVSAVSDGVLCGLVQNLVVHPKYRQRGLGTRLLRELSRAMARQGVNCLYALGARNPGARAFFGRVGFRPLNWNVFVRLHR